MEKLIRPARAFYGVSMAGIGIQQFIYAEFRPVILSYWRPSMPGLAIAAYLTGAALVIAGLWIAFSKNARTVALILGGCLLALFVFSHAYFQLFLSQYDFHLGLWTDPLKDLALSGGALVMAATYPEKKPFANKLIFECGRIFFAVMLLLFGIDHFLYTDFVATLVPNWLPGHLFWTYIGAAGLIGAGVCILIKFKIYLVSMLTGIMLLLWFIILHVPRAIADPGGAKGNELTSVFEALAFSGIAFAIAWKCRSKTA